MTLAPLEETDKRVLMFGGKGGVGKTTSSAATAIHYAKMGRRVLIITSDLTPSLSDIFETNIGPHESPVPGIERLYGLEVSPDEVMQRWKKKFGPQVYEAASALVDLSYEEIVSYAAMAPGIQEEFMLDYILERVKRREEYDMVIWDTAPAGDTLRLLGLPRRFIEHLRTAPKVYMEVRDSFSLSKTPFIEIIESWKALAKEVSEFFTSPHNVEFILVTIPEALGVYQSRRVMKDLAEHGLDVRHLIVNNVIVDTPCDFLRKRREMQQPYIKMLHEEYGNALVLTKVPLLPHEVKGIPRLEEIERILFGDE
jgi:arsenite-transporting ATPase